jgi:hypothetical protein
MEGPRRTLYSIGAAERFQLVLSFRWDERSIRGGPLNSLAGRSNFRDQIDGHAPDFVPFGLPEMVVAVTPPGCLAEGHKRRKDSRQLGAHLGSPVARSGDPNANFSRRALRRGR